MNFTGLVEDFGAATLNPGDSSGWYVTGEYVLSDFYYVAPTFRYEKWNRFRKAAGYQVESVVLGANWYLYTEVASPRNVIVLSGNPEVPQKHNRKIDASPKPFIKPLMTVM